MTDDRPSQDFLDPDDASRTEAPRKPRRLERIDGRLQRTEAINWIQLITLGVLLGKIVFADGARNEQIASHSKEIAKLQTDQEATTSKVHGLDLRLTGVEVLANVRANTGDPNGPGRGGRVVK